MPLRVSPLPTKKSQKSWHFTWGVRRFWLQNGYREDYQMTEQVTATDQPKTADLLYGVPAIADFLGVRQRTAYHLVDTRRIPFFRMGKILCARRSRLLAGMEAMETA